MLRFVLEKFDFKKNSFDENIFYQNDHVEINFNVSNVVILIVT